MYAICWHLLCNSNTRERVKLDRNRCLHARSQIRIVVADREFIGREGFTWLQTQNILFAIKEKRLHQGVKRYPCESFLQTCTSISKPSCANPAAFMSSLCIVSAIRLKDGFLDGIRHHKCTRPSRFGCTTSQKRWGIEVLFANLKSRGCAFISCMKNAL